MTKAAEVLKYIIEQDEFSDAEKLRQLKDGKYYSPAYVRFCLKHEKRYSEYEDTLGASSWLDIGCGTGGAFNLLPITAAVEPNTERRKSAKVNGTLNPKGGLRFRRVDVAPYYAEDLPFGDKAFSTVSYLRGFFQCRSDAEALIEINRVLRTGGTFLVDVPTEACVQTPCGRTWGLKGLHAWLRQFGFVLKTKGPCDGELQLLAYTKEAEFGVGTYLKPQLVAVPQPLLKNPVSDFYEVRNFVAWDWWAPASLKAKATVYDRGDREAGILPRICFKHGTKIPWTLL